jgi:hypothetical protein
MSDFSSHLVVDDENSGCESDVEIRELKRQTKNRKKRKTQQQKDPVAMTSTNTDDETESQLNFEESPVNSNAFSLNSNAVSMQYQEKMRRRLQFFFMNPVEKWQAKRR